MWWQPENSGEDVDQWALDEVVVNGYKNMKLLEDDFDSRLVSALKQFCCFVYF